MISKYLKGDISIIISCTSNYLVCSDVSPKMGMKDLLRAAELELEDRAVWVLVRVAGMEVGIRPKTPSATVWVAA